MRHRRPSNPLQMASAHCRAIIAHHSKSFTLASKLLPRAVRNDAVVVYAWCRRCDDAVDRVTGELQVQALLALEKELDALYNPDLIDQFNNGVVQPLAALTVYGQTTGPTTVQPHQVGLDRSSAAAAPETAAVDEIVLQAFAEVVQRCRIPREYAQELLAGMRMDVVGHDYQTWRDLLHYCYRVAGVVGLMMSHVLGVRSDVALPHAAHLGTAMQLTNICRDVLEDWQRGRRYLPAELFPLEMRDKLQPETDRHLPESCHNQLVHAVRQLLVLADHYYQSGDAGLPFLSWRCALAIRTARRVYAAIGDRLAQQQYNVWAGRAVVPTRQKIRLAARALGQTLTELPTRMWQQWTPQPPSVVLRFPDAVRLDGITPVF